MQEPDRAEALHREHHLIVDALRRGATPRARAAVDTHALATPDLLHQD
ncbi:hypothetical protein ACQXVK_16710 [Curtobacterium sp. AB451]